MVLRLSSLHPYPAMMPDELARVLVRDYGGDRVLDPFCGTGRVCVAAAEGGASAVGIDINPLAILISEAKNRSVEVEDLGEVLEECVQARASGVLRDAAPVERQLGRRVEWLGEQGAGELGEIVAAINRKPRRRSTLLVLATVVSATVREVSFARRDQWKLHRLSATARVLAKQDAWSVFERRMRRTWREIRKLEAFQGECTFVRGDARRSLSVLGMVGEGKPVDAVITSPPYGDSRTTVQYGAMSSLCMEVVAGIRGFRDGAFLGAQVDRHGLGGGGVVEEREATKILADYWAGGKGNPQRRRAGTYLQDLRESVTSIAKCLRPGGLFVTVIARRLTGGWRLYSDKCICDALTGIGFVEVVRKRRRIVGKVTPATVNRKARMGLVRNRRSQVRTMREEWILVYRAPRRAARGGGGVLSRKAMHYG